MLHPNISSTRRASVPWLATVYGSVALVALVASRLERATSFAGQAQPVDWTGVVVAGLGGVFLIEGVLLLASRLLDPRGRGTYWPLVWRLVHSVLLLALVVDHQFFLKTGSELRFSEALYALQHLPALVGLLGSEVDSALLLQGALACLLIGLAIVCEGREPRLTASVAARAGLLGSLFVGVAALALTTAGISGFHRLSATPDAFQVDLAGTEPLYRRPSLKLGVPKRRPNIVLIVAESTRADALGPDDAGRVRMPFLTDLATRSLIADSAYTTVPHTSKALVGLLCGMNARLRMPITETRIGNLPLTCLPHILNALGYRTAFMQTALGSFEKRPALTHNIGFETTRTQKDFQGFAQTGYLGMDEFAMLDPAHDWMSASDTPFFLTLLTVSSHHPYEVPNEPLRENLTAREQYDRSLTHVDRFIKAVYEPLNQKKAFERDTVFIVVGDHGEAFGEHGVRQHDVVPYEEVVRVPWIVHGPSWIGEPTRVSGLRSHLDLMPSVLEWLGVEHDGRLPGLPISSEQGHEAVTTFCWYDESCIALRKGNRKYVYRFGRRPMEVYDLETDAAEQTNLASELAPEDLDEIVNEMLKTRSLTDQYYGMHQAGQ